MIVNIELLIKKSIFLEEISEGRKKRRKNVYFHGHRGAQQHERIERGEYSSIAFLELSCFSLLVTLAKTLISS
jgi:hypothetical protein